jgi:hypothetical protein
VSAYACPMSASSPNLVASQAETEMPGPCGSMGGKIDPAQPGLCLQHAQYGFQSTTQADTAAVMPVVLAPAFAVTVVPEGLATCTLPKLRPSDRRWSEPLALSILHCCFRF